jgi:hypothetical protein
VRKLRTRRCCHVAKGTSSATDGLSAVHPSGLRERQWDEGEEASTDITEFLLTALHCVTYSRERRNRIMSVIIVSIFQRRKLRLRDRMIDAQDEPRGNC